MDGEIDVEMCGLRSDECAGQEVNPGHDCG